MGFLLFVHTRFESRHLKVQPNQMLMILFIKCKIIEEKKKLYDYFGRLNAIFNSSYDNDDCFIQSVAYINKSCGLPTNRGVYIIRNTPLAVLVVDFVRTISAMPPHIRKS